MTDEEAFACWANDVDLPIISYEGGWAYDAWMKRASLQLHLKPLEWKVESVHGLQMQVARVLGLQYQLCTKVYSPGWLVTLGGLDLIYDGPDEDDAKAFAHRDYRERVCSLFEDGLR